MLELAIPREVSVAILPMILCMFARRQEATFARTVTTLLEYCKRDTLAMVKLHSDF
jgi:hypothetical protein